MTLIHRKNIVAVKMVLTENGRVELAKAFSGDMQAVPSRVLFGSGGWTEDGDIYKEAIGTVSGSSFQGQAESLLGLSPGSVTVETGAGNLTDDGAGNLVGGIGSGTIGYNDGQVEIEFTSQPPDGTTVILGGKFRGVGADASLGDVVIDSVSGALGDYFAVLPEVPVMPGSVSVSDEGGLALSEASAGDRLDVSGALSGDGTGVVDRRSGLVQMRFTSAPTGKITIKYKSLKHPDSYTRAVTALSQQVVSRDLFDGEFCKVSRSGRNVSYMMQLKEWDAIQFGQDVPELFEVGVENGHGVLVYYGRMRGVCKTGSTGVSVLMVAPL